MKDPTLVEDVGKPKSNERVKINFGGTVFETTVYTLSRLDDNCAGRNDQESLAQGRSYSSFPKDGEKFALPTDRDARESLRVEAEFYNLPGLAKTCSPDLRMGDCVQWKESAIEEWWKFMTRCEYYRAKPCPISVDCENCKHCGSGVCGCDGSETLGPNAKAINYDEWISLKHKMKLMKGYVMEIVPNTCCDVEHGFCCGVDWDNGWRTHNNQSELRLATQQ